MKRSFPNSPTMSSDPNETYTFVPDEIIRNIDRVLDSMEKARQDLLIISEEKRPSKNEDQET